MRILRRLPEDYRNRASSWRFAEWGQIEGWRVIGAIEERHFRPVNTAPPLMLGLGAHTLASPSSRRLEIRSPNLTPAISASRNRQRRQRERSIRQEAMFDKPSKSLAGASRISHS